MKGDVAVKSAPAPFHSVVLVSILILVFTLTLPSFESIDEIATVRTFTNRIFPQYISLQNLLIYRLLCTVFILAITVQVTFFSKGWVFTSTYLPNSKLISNCKIEIRGLRTQYPFTSWSWNLLGLSFAMNAYIVYLVWKNDNDNTDTTMIPKFLLRLAFLTFEMAIPTTLLVAFVVRYVIWPQLLKSSKTDNIKHWRALIWHNANVIMALVEVSLFGGMPIRIKDVSVAPIFGLSYVLFSWFMADRWLSSPDLKKKKGPQFLYFFFDTTLGVTTSVALICLLITLIVFYGLFSIIDDILIHTQGGVLVHGFLTLLIASVVCRFRD